MARRTRELREISIRNLGVIEEATIPFGSGFNVITGETGAGKTMVLTGLSLLSGDRADTDLIRQGTEKLVVTAQLSMEDPVQGRLKGLIKEHEPETEEGSLLLQRTITKEGRGRAILGSDQVTAGLLSDFAMEFFTIHGQSTNHRLTEKRYQLALLDQSSDQSTAALADFQQRLHKLREKEREVNSLRKALADREAHIERLQKFLSDLSKLKVRTDEWVETEERIHRLDSTEEFVVGFQTAISHLDDENSGVLIQIKSAIRAIEKIESSDRTLVELISRLRQSEIELRDVAAEIRSEIDDIEVEPGELDRLRERRATLKQFLQKHDSSALGEDANSALNALLVSKEEREELLRGLRAGDDEILSMIDECDLLRSEALTSAEALRKARESAAKFLEESVNAELGNLALAGSRFEIRFHPLPEESLSTEGLDEIEFLFTSHHGGALLPLNKGISGGELSRVMLAIELALVARREIGTLIFDEIDAGIGGETGLILGERIAKLAERYQVVVITHLAQVAAWADRHFNIEKNSDGNFVLSSVREVTGEDRISEIARMLSGQSDLAAAKTHAKELLKHAGK